MIYLWRLLMGMVRLMKEKRISVKLLNFFPVIAEDSSGRMIEIDAAQVMTIPKQIKAQEVVKRGFMSNLLFDNIAVFLERPKLF